MEVEVGEAALVVRAEGEDPVELPYAVLDLSLGGDANGQLVCTPRGREDQLYLERRGLEGELSGAPADFVGVYRGLVGAHRRGWAKGRLVVLGVVVSVVAAFVVLAVEAQALAVGAIPYSLERELGEQAFVGYREELDLRVDPALQAFVEETGERLLGAYEGEVPYAFSYHVARDPQVNAFAMPGGYVVVLTGLIAEGETPEQVAGVVAHEVSHVLLRHSVRQMVNQAGIFTALAVFVDPLGAAELYTATSLLGLKFSRDYEAEADALGVELLHRAGIDPRGLPEFFGGLGGALKPPELLSTHPSDETRVETLRAQIAELPAKDYTPLEVDWERLQALAGGAGP